MSSSAAMQAVQLPDPAAVQRAVRAALDEDSAGDDVTTRWSVDADASGQADLVSKAVGVVAGVGVAALTFELVDSRLRVTQKLEEGAHVRPGDVVLHVAGPLHGLLTGERTALNFMQRLSGIATLTSQYRQAVAGTHAQIFDTRKTAPGLRVLDKFAVAVGGGRNHRMHLSGMVLLKENHIRAAGGVEEAVRRIRANMQKEGRALKIDVEVETLEQFETALRLGVDWIMLDNMSLDDTRTAVRAATALGDRKPIMEASGNVSLTTVRAIAETGVDIISIGSLTHSAPALDLSLLVR